MRRPLHAHGNVLRGCRPTPPRIAPVLEQCRKAYDDWRAADGKARELEAALTQAWEHYAVRREGPPPLELMTAVTRSREDANDKLTIAMAMLELAHTHGKANPAYSRA